MLSKALVAGTSQRKLEELAKFPDVQLTLVTPPYWQHDNGTRQILEKLYTTGYRMIVTPCPAMGTTTCTTILTWDKSCKRYSQKSYT
ncbi:hypothetical protein EI42_01076 [Thermosporothrix hazakensis]|jgi:hypothetical protein|uniref:Uncharacterized protein n=2 Tax=Thermosporothrix hazakensis TaxID=644383 RepID=A0A326UC38_THEHA|nr:hypothetical protein [Thermosporothrix hazakensis]PZW34239.1 hypothetical protein EI42_01076 [Thermosporothrix hazakensis]